MIAISSRDMSEYFDTVLKARQFIKSSVGSMYLLRQLWSLHLRDTKFVKIFKLI